MNKPSILREVNLKIAEDYDDPSTLALYAQHPTLDLNIDEWLCDAEPRPTYAIYLAEATMLAYGRAAMDITIELEAEHQRPRHKWRLVKTAGTKMWRWEDATSWDHSIEPEKFLNILADTVSVRLVLPKNENKDS